MRQLTSNVLNRLMMLQALALAGIPTAATGQVVRDTSGVRPDSVAVSAAVTPAERKMYPGISAGSPREDYLRSLQVAGVVPAYPWSLRAFSPRELDRLRPRTDSHPRFAVPEFNADSGHLPFDLQIVPINADAWFNSAFPFGLNDGAVWRGRGVTAAVTGGVQGRWGPVSLTVAPIAFWAQNRAFALMQNNVPGPLGFGDGQFAGGIDLPQRFGDDPYWDFDLGQSALRLDTRFVSVGFSAANQWWGPMSEFPFILGDNAAGFSHVFLGTGTPLNVYVGTIHAKVVYGQLGQSDYSPVGGEGRRFASGIVGTFSPRGLSTLEIGGGRFFHTVWPARGPSWPELRRPFEALFKSGLPGDQQGRDGAAEQGENQLATLYFRWVFPGRGLEIYGETGREDHSWDRRDLILELEHAGSYGFGLRKVWHRPEHIHAFRLETMNFQTRAGGLHRGEGGIYIHAPIRQGHTHLGQLLGTGFGVASAGGTVAAFERHTSSSSTVVSWSRYVRMERYRDYLRTPWEVVTDETDVQHVFEVERRIIRDGRQIRLGLGGVYEFQRNLEKDAFNLMLSAGIDLFPRGRPETPTTPPRASTAQ